MKDTTIEALLMDFKESLVSEKPPLTSTHSLDLLADTFGVYGVDSAGKVRSFFVDPTVRNNF